MKVQNEPVGIAGAVIVIVTAAISLVTAFGLPVSREQGAAIIGFVTAATGLIAFLVARSKVTPTKNVAAQVDTSTGNVVAGPAADQNTGASVVVNGTGIATEVVEPKRSADSPTTPVVDDGPIPPAGSGTV